MKRGMAPPPAPSALAVGMLEDGNRALFLCRANTLGQETLELPCILLQKGENPVAAIGAEFRRQTGIDAQVHEILFERRMNAGSRKRKVFIPVLVFKVTARKSACSPAPEFSGYKWLERGDLTGKKLARNATWLY